MKDKEKQCYGYGFILERSELLARRCLLLEDRAVKIHRERTMDMTNVERVIKAIENRGFTITQYPCNASIQKEYEEQVFLGKYLEFGCKNSFRI